MPFDIEEFVRLRPFLYHVTDRANLPGLQESKRLRTAASVILAANKPERVGMRRAESLVLDTADGRVMLKDQRPLIAANMELTAGWSLDEFVRYLNGFTYFWPGLERGPIGPGQRLLDHYEAEGPVVVRVPTADLLRENHGLEPEFSAFNSGAPRYHFGRRAVRGPHLFSTSAKFPRRAAQVVEVAFRGDVMLPGSTLLRSAAGWGTLV